MEQEHRPSNSDAVARTFERGPSDPVVFADGPGTWVSTSIAATPAAVWAAVTDIDLPTQFSDEPQDATWTGDGPALGASFIGRNEHPAIGQWEVECTVDVFDDEQAFGWATSDRDNPGARWRFRLEPNGDRTTLRYEVTLGPGPSGTTMAIASMPDKEARIIHRRIGELHANMARTVEGIRQVVERE